MNTINKKPILVDFNNMEEDSSVRIYATYKYFDGNDVDFQFKNGEIILITDGEIEQVGVLEFRDGMWVAVPIKGTLKDVDENSPYHVRNTSKN